MNIIIIANYAFSYLVSKDLLLISCKRRYHAFYECCHFSGAPFRHFRIIDGSNSRNKFHILIPTHRQVWVPVISVPSGSEYRVVDSLFQDFSSTCNLAKTFTIQKRAQKNILCLLSKNILSRLLTSK